MSKRATSLKYLFCATAAISLLAACGGGGGSPAPAPAPNPAPAPAPAPTPAPSPPPSSTLPLASTLAQQCSPQNTLAPADKRTASLDTERRWVRSYMNEAYLWYSEVPTVDPSAAAFNLTDVPRALDNYFQALKTPALTPSNKRKDEFSFTFGT